MLFCFRFVFEDQIEFIKASVMEGDEVWLKLSIVILCSCGNVVKIFFISCYLRSFLAVC